MRGQVITIGKRKFTIPKEKPVTDSDIVEANQLIADMGAAIAPHKRMVKTIEAVQKMMREDVEVGLTERDEREIQREAPLFTTTLFKEDDAPNGKSSMRRLTRCGGPVGWQAEVASMHAEGASDETVLTFLSKYPVKDLSTQTIGKKSLAIRGGKNPAVVSVSSVKDAEEKNVRAETVEFDGDPLILAFRLAWDIVAPVIAEMRRNAKKTA